MFDMFDTSDEAGLERMSYARFQIAHTVRRPTQAPGKFEQWDSLQLPVGSVLHTVHGLETLTAPADGLPDPALPVVVNEKLPIYLKIATKVASTDAVPFGVKENHIYRPNTLLAQVAHFFQQHRRYKRIVSDRLLGTLPNTLNWVDYSPLNTIKVGGTLHGYRKFDILFRTVLNQLVAIGGGAHHYILLPQNGHVFPRTMLQRAFSNLSTSTLNPFLTDPSIFPILHILGYVYGKTQTSKVTPYKEDVALLGKDDPLFGTLHSTSLLERIPRELFGAINFVFQKDNRAVVYNLGDLDLFSDNPSFYTKFYRHIMNLRLTESSVPAHIDPDSDQFDSFVAATAETDTDSTREPVTPAAAPKPVDALAERLPTKTTPAVVTPVLTADAIPVAVSAFPGNFETKVRSAALVKTAAIVHGEPKKEQRRNLLLDNHLKVMLAGKPLGEHIQPLASQTIAPKPMAFLTATPEPSYQTSSLLAMDKTYHNHVFHHDLGKVVGSLAKHGLFASTIDEDKLHTEMDRTTTYRVQLHDLDGKSHHVKFTLPDIDEDGNMKLGGIEYRLTRQIANVPICKISPSRVNLSSYYNKVIVERIQSKRFSYEHDMVKLIANLRDQGLITAVSGSAGLPQGKIAYDYSAIGRNFVEIGFDGFTLHFASDGLATDHADTKTAAKLGRWQSHYGHYVGHGPQNSFLFWDLGNQIHQVSDSGVIASWPSFQTMVADRLGHRDAVMKTSLEWTQASIINQTIPLIFILAYHFGLKAVLTMIRLDYVFYPNKRDAVREIDDIAVELADGVLVFNRYPIARSLLAAGLCWVDLRDIAFGEMSVPEIYGRIFQKKGLSVGVLKGLTGFFDFFVDPVTESVLEKMGEPTNFGDLLLRANVMLTDYHATESSSIALHRFRLTERFTGIVYNEIYRSLANHRTNPASKKSFSINPEAVFQKIVQDATVAPNDVINPVHEVKQRANFTFTGHNGRTGNSFVLRDRIYPKDGLGVISDAVPDSGKVGITAYLSASPNIDDVHGLAKPYKPGDPLEPAQILSIGSMVMPGGTTDDGKRNSYLSIQISHYVPNYDEGETLAVRTGYDQVLPHLVGDTFATAASHDGVVQAVDAKHQVITVRYADTRLRATKTLKLPYLDPVIDGYRGNQTPIGVLVPDSDIGDYQIGTVFALTKTTYGKLTDSIRCESADAIPDKDLLRKQSHLLHDLNRGKIKALYYLRFTPLSPIVPGPLKSYSFADKHTPISGSYLLQKRVTPLKAGDAFKTGAILTYNPGFFVPDPLSNQVTFKHGVTATVALIEKSTNHEDACEISERFADRIKMVPSHNREITTTRSAAILQMVTLGDHVETSDSLCIISDAYLIGASLDTTVENLDIMERLNRQTPSAGYNGTIVRIKMLYACDKERLSDNLKGILKTYEKTVRDQFKALVGDTALPPPDRPGWVKPGTKYKGIDFVEDTVVLEFMIQEELGMSEGDKLCVMNSSKSIVSHVSEKSHYTESGLEIDMLFSTTSIVNRIVASPYWVGICERNMQTLKDQVLALYFE